MDNGKIKIAAVVGPTSSGKTRFGIELAKRWNGEVISADSMQIYEGMDIGSAKPTVEEMDGVPHHLIGIIPRDQNFSVAQYAELAHKTIQEVHSRGKFPIIVGGTGLYIDSVINNITFIDTEVDEQLRRSLYEQAQSEGSNALWEKLKNIDPQSAAKIAPNNTKRVIRALEIFYTTGMTMTEQNERSRRVPTPYETIKLGIKTKDRAELYDRINRRVDEMMQRGLLDEARALFESDSGTNTASKAIGCKEFIPYFKGEITLDEAVETLKKETRHYAKRQLTWFMRDKEIQWLTTGGQCPLTVSTLTLCG